MNHEQMAVVHRIKALKEGIRETQDMISQSMFVYNSEEPLTEEKQKELQNNLFEIRTFLLWLAEQ